MVERAAAGVQVVGTSASALVDGIRTLASLSEAERQRMGWAGRRWVEREHSRQVLSERLDAFLSELVGQ